jgi:hypothetical protein
MNMMHQTCCVSSSCCKNTLGLRRVLAIKAKGVVLGFENGQDILIILGRWVTCVPLLVVIVLNLKGYNRIVALDGFGDWVL